MITREMAQSKADRAAELLRERILNGHYAPGYRLTLTALAEELGCGMTPVREALRKLQAQNLVDLIPNKGARIRVITLSELGEVYAVRAELEGYAASLAAAAFSRDQVAALESIQSQMEAVVAAIKLPAGQRPAESFINAQLTRFNDEFHGVIRSVAGNALLDRLVLDLQRRFPKDYVWKTIHSADQIETINVTEHRQILDALRLNDPESARGSMSEHVRNSGRLVLGHLQERGAAT